MAARRSRKGRRRNRGRFGGLYKLLSILLILAAIILGCVVFFRVNTMLVEGNSRYTAEEVIAASGVQQGDNLFALNKSHMISQILTRLPYVDDLSIQRKLPDTLVFYVTESVPVAWVESGGTCWLLDSAETQNLPETCPLCGGPVENRTVGTREGGLEKQPCIHAAYGEDYIFPEYTVYQCVCTQCGQWQSDTWQVVSGQQRLVCHGYQ